MGEMIATLKMPNGTSCECTFDEATTVKEAISALTEYGLLERIPDDDPYCEDGYVCVVRQGNKVSGSETLYAGGLRDGGFADIITRFGRYG